REGDAVKVIAARDAENLDPITLARDCPIAAGASADRRAKAAAARRDKELLRGDFEEAALSVLNDLGIAIGDAHDAPPARAGIGPRRDLDCAAAAPLIPRERDPRRVAFRSPGTIVLYGQSQAALPARAWNTDVTGADQITASGATDADQSDRVISP